MDIGVGIDIRRLPSCPDPTSTASNLNFCGFPLPTFLDERSSIPGRVALLANGHGTLWLQHSRYEVPLRRVVVVIPKLTEFSRFSSFAGSTSTGCPYPSSLTSRRRTNYSRSSSWRTNWRFRTIRLHFILSVKTGWVTPRSESSPEPRREMVWN